MEVRGILIQGRDGQEYLLGFRRRPGGELTGPPTLSRRGPSGAFQSIDDLAEASRVARTQFGPRRPRLIGPGWGRELALWGLFRDALEALPALPTWPPWSPSAG